MSKKNSLSRSGRLQLPASTPHLCIAVLGLPSHCLQRSEENNLLGVGKSCLCSRFVLPSLDDYQVLRDDHSSLLSASAFESSQYHQEHFLYFGSAVKLIARRLAVFHLVEHTTFVDESFRPHAGGSDYGRRATRSSLYCHGKLAYLGMHYANSTASGRARKRRRHGFLERFPCTFDGHRSAVAGYVIAIDASRSSDEEELQLSSAETLARLIRQQPSPQRIVVAVTKADECTPSQLDRLSLQLRRRLGSVAIFNVSARLGVSVDAPFFYLYAQVLHRGGGRGPDPPLWRPSFAQARQAKEEAALRAAEEVRTFLRNTVNRFDMTWREFSLIAGGSNAYIALFSLKGLAFCQKLFRDRLVDILRSSLKETLSAGLANHPDLASEWESQVSSGKCLFCQGSVKRPSAETNYLDTDTSSSDSMEMVSASSYYNGAIFDMLGPTRQHPEYIQEEKATRIPLLLPTPQYYGNVQHCKGLVRRILLERAAEDEKMMDSTGSSKSLYSPRLFYRAVSLCALRNDHSPSIPSSPDCQRPFHIKGRHARPISSLLRMGCEHKDRRQILHDIETGSSPDFARQFSLKSFPGSANWIRPESDSDSGGQSDIDEHKPISGEGKACGSDQPLSTNLRRTHSDPLDKFSRKRHVHCLQPKEVVRLRLKPQPPKVIVTTESGGFRGTPNSLSSSCSPQSSQRNSILLSEDTDSSFPNSAGPLEPIINYKDKQQTDLDRLAQHTDLNPSPLNGWLLPRGAAVHLFSDSDDAGSPLPDTNGSVLSVSYTLLSDSASFTLADEEEDCEVFKDDDVIYETVGPDRTMDDNASLTEDDVSRCATVLIEDSESSDEDGDNIPQRMKNVSSGQLPYPENDSTRGCVRITPNNGPHDVHQLSSQLHSVYDTSISSLCANRSCQPMSPTSPGKSLLLPSSCRRAKSLGTLEGIVSTVI